nr:MAG TPA: hypothetical protein [Caudoviricetes sp.]
MQYAFLFQQIKNFYSLKEKIYYILPQHAISVFRYIMFKIKRKTAVIFRLSFNTWESNLLC